MHGPSRRGEVQIPRFPFHALAPHRAAAVAHEVVVDRRRDVAMRLVNLLRRVLRQRREERMAGSHAPFGGRVVQKVQVAPAVGDIARVHLLQVDGDILPAP
jgi:hypothetical protein